MEINIISETCYNLKECNSDSIWHLYFWFDFIIFYFKLLQVSISCFTNAKLADIWFLCKKSCSITYHIHNNYLVVVGKLLYDYMYHHISILQLLPEMTAEFVCKDSLNMIVHLTFLKNWCNPVFCSWRMKEFKNQIFFLFTLRKSKCLFIVIFSLVFFCYQMRNFKYFIMSSTNLWVLVWYFICIFHKKYFHTMRNTAVFNIVS